MPFVMCALEHIVRKFNLFDNIYTELSRQISKGFRGALDTSVLIRVPIYVFQSAKRFAKYLAGPNLDFPLQPG